MEFDLIDSNIACIFVVDPAAPPNVRVKPFGDLAEGAEFLTWKRNKNS